MTLTVRNLASSSVSKLAFQSTSRYEYSGFNGISIKVMSDHVGDDSAKMEGVRRLQLLKPEPSNGDTSHPLLTSAHEMTGVDYIQETLHCGCCSRCRL